MNKTAFPTALTVVDLVAARRENVRTWLALIVISMLVGLVAALVTFVWKRGGGDDAQLLLTGLFTPVVGIAGTVLGFYFGAESQKE